MIGSYAKKLCEWTITKKCKYKCTIPWPLDINSPQQGDMPFTSISQLTILLPLSPLTEGRERVRNYWQNLAISFYENKPD